METDMSRDSDSDLQAGVLRWFETNRRDLPWRRRRDPYAIWVSEIMLQQTRVETVLPYYDDFLKRFPCIEALAAAPLDQVLAAWSGLGYYRRARNMHRSARQIVAAGGSFPDRIETLKALPGVGDYTAAAVGSIAFGIPEPAVDGNVERLVARWLGIEDDPKRGEARRRIRQGAHRLLSSRQPGDSNQAMMELGATVCKPASPLCFRCPLVGSCVAHESGRPEDFPSRPSRASLNRVSRRAFLVRRDGRLLLFRRSEDEGQLAGMWELPWSDEGPQAAARADLARRYGGRWRLRGSRGRVRHAITDRLYEIEVMEADVEHEAVVAEAREAGWFGPGEIENLAVSSQVRKVLAVEQRWRSAALARRKQVPAE
jgi:A/G-specific adenine glycosylase